MMNQEYLSYFPKKSCYPNQTKAMDVISAALLKKQVVLFEGACGTGKTLSALAPALHTGKKEKKTVIIATNVHQQMNQFIDEAREIKKKVDIKVIVLKGKMTMCPKQDMDYDTCSLLRENTYKLVDQERNFGKLKTEIKSVRDKLKREKDSGLIEVQRRLSQEFDKEERSLLDMKKNSCDMLLNLLKVDTDDFRKWLFSGVRTPEEVSEWAYSTNCCGYELLKRHMKEADLLICNYHHFLDEEIRTNVLGWMEKGLNDVITIFDEAHNIESAARSHSSRTLTEITINRALDEMMSNLDASFDDAQVFLRVLLETMISTYNMILDKNFGEREKIGEEWYDLPIEKPEERNGMFMAKLMSAEQKAGIKKPDETIERMRKLGLKIDALYEKQFNEGKSPVKKISNILIAASFLSDYLKHSNDRNYFPILSVRRQNREIYGRLELFTCIPKIVTAPLINSFYASIIMSATITPFENLKRTLGITRDTCECAFEITFPPKRRLTLAVSVPPLIAKERGNPQTKGRITKLLNEIIENTDGNVLIFFPSFSEAYQYKNLIRCNVPVFLDEIGVSAQKIRDEFFRIGEGGKKAVLISYIWGTLTEGVDYKDGRCRTVVIVGVGFPALNIRMRAIEAAYDAEYGQGWDYAIVTPTIMKVRQAMGRVLRSPADYGTRILVDERYSTHTICEINWNEIPGKCSTELTDFLEQNNYLKLDRPGKIIKLNSNVIKIFNEIDSYLFKLNEKKTHAVLESKGKKIQEFAVDVVGLFNWENLPGYDERKLLNFLNYRFNIDRETKPVIEKTDNDKTIKITYPKNSLILRLNDEKTKVNLIIDDGRTCEFITKTENGKLKIYDTENTYLMISRWDSVLKFFPGGEREEFIDVEPDRVKYSLMNFFKDVNKMRLSKCSF